MTVLGGRGFIGSHVVGELNRRGIVPRVPERNEDLTGVHLGDILYCIGVTADFRHRPADTVTAHVSKLVEVLTHSHFDSLLYVSSTRVYRGAQAADEESCLAVRPHEPDDLYNVTKLAGECAALTMSSRTRVARVSNVYGNDFTSENFLSSLCRDAVRNGEIIFRTSLDSEKDYVSVEDVALLLVDIALKGNERIYNVAGGANIRTQQIAEVVQQSAACRITVDERSPRTYFPVIPIGRVQREFGFLPRNVLSDIPLLLEAWKRS